MNTSVTLDAGALIVTLAAINEQLHKLEGKISRTQHVTRYMREQYDATQRAQRNLSQAYTESIP